MSEDWSSRLARAQAAQAAGDLAEAARSLAPAVSDTSAPDDALRLLAGALRARGRAAEATPALEALTRRRPTSAVAEHNLAAALGDCDRAAESEAAARRALAKGGRAPETWLVLGRALVGQGRLDEAEAALRSALTERGDFLAAFRDLAQLIWMRRGDVDALTEPLAPLVELAKTREDAVLLLSSILRDTAGDTAALEALGPWLARPSPEIAMAAAAAASGLDPGLALEHARRAAALAPDDPRAALAEGAALIAAGRPDAAAPRLERSLASDPGNQHARALLLTAWRLTADPRALTPDDYRRLVRVFPLGEGPDRADWLARTAAALRRLHSFRAHPFQQSVLNGAQSRIDPRAAGDIDIDRLFAALTAPVQTYINEVKPDWRGRATGVDWRISGAWSVKLSAGGRHADHVHPRAWISSAVYIETPARVEAGGREGWIRFGAAGIGAAFSLPAEHWVRPEPGSLVLFPSFLWHGTEPFTGSGERLTVAFDIEPETDA
ncbi:MAG TPA: putative 2OG-Fe(II) oxygenase [Brevundimonas sp.]|uniref:putative 2OG-Fe(II) oxygenase n=1 Tax=Brevundimonas sp. TaxID=1871086 RepID=UPI002ED88881